MQHLPQGSRPIDGSPLYINRQQADCILARKGHSATTDSGCQHSATSYLLTVGVNPLPLTYLRVGGRLRIITMWVQASGFTVHRPLALVLDSMFVRSWPPSLCKIPVQRSESTQTPCSPSLSHQVSWYSGVGYIVYYSEYTTSWRIMICLVTILRVTCYNISNITMRIIIKLNITVAAAAIILCCTKSPAVQLRYGTGGEQWEFTGSVKYY